MATSIGWSDIDKVKFFSIGTGVYSGIGICLHPITVIKTRQQVLLGKKSNAKSASGKILHKQLGLYSVIRDLLSSSPGDGSTSSSADKGRRVSLSNARNLFKGLGIVLAVAVPARALYIGVLESSKETIKTFMTKQQDKGITWKRKLGMKSAGEEEYLSGGINKTIDGGMVSSISYGIAGGFASISAQALIVPMDVISQRQMIMGTSYSSNASGPENASARSVFRSILQSEGWIGLYRGFGMSLFTSLPGGTTWWATYGGCQYELNRLVTQFNADKVGSDSSHTDTMMWKGPIQLISSVCAAITATALTQPLDVVKTKLQVQKIDNEPATKSILNGNHELRGLKNKSTKLSPPTAIHIAREIMATSGIKGFYSGTVPRVMHMTLWGTIMSSAYEYLKYVSVKA